MLCIYNKSTDPYFNLAAEEYFLKNFQDNFFMLWQNKSSVIVGKNQNALSEINLEYVNENNIPVVRRLSGGGAVFHDMGNINFTFISGGEEGDFNNFKKFTAPIIDVLNSLSVNAEFSGRNDLTIEGKKFSGNAQYNYRNRVLHHGTLLFSSNIQDISSALKTNPLKFQGKGVKSVESRVTNISSHLKEQMTIQEFIDLVMKHIMQNQKEHTLYEMTQEDILDIEKLAREKYSTWEWNFGSSPEYSFKNTGKFQGGTVEVNLDIKKGQIENIKLYGDFFGVRDISELEESLKGVNHSRQDVLNVLDGVKLSDYLLNISAEELLNLFF